jgi:hypothetical protein
MYVKTINKLASVVLEVSQTPGLQKVRANILKTVVNFSMLVKTISKDGSWIGNGKLLPKARKPSVVK